MYRVGGDCRTAPATPGLLIIRRPGTLYTSRKPLQHLLATGVPSCEEPGSAHEQTCKISREKLPHPLKQRRDELRKRNFFVSLPLWCRLLILLDSCAEWGWPDTLGTSQGGRLRQLRLIFSYPGLPMSDYSVSHGLFHPSQSCIQTPSPIRTQG